MRGDVVIYEGRGSKMVKVAEPRLPQNANFVITWREKDWSGFRTLAECVKQFPELEEHPNGCDVFMVVER